MRFLLLLQVGNTLFLLQYFSWHHDAVYRGRRHTTKLSFATRRLLVCCVISNDGPASWSKSRTSGNAIRLFRELESGALHILALEALIVAFDFAICL